MHEEHLSDPEAARDACERAFDADPASPGVAATLVRLHRRAERWDALRRVLERAGNDGPEAERTGFLCSLGELLAQGKANLQAPWLGLTGFFVIAVMLSLLIFIGEGVRDAFDPRKIFAGAPPPEDAVDTGDERAEEARA